MNVEAPIQTTMTMDEFLLWADSWEDGERYELVEGHPLRLQSEKVSHAEVKVSAWLALRNGLRAAGLNCQAFVDGVSVRINDRSLREPDGVINCGPYDPAEIFLPNPVLVVEVISPSSVKDDLSRKLIDYFQVPSILHYLIILGDDQGVIHHRRAAAGGEISTSILGLGAIVDLSPPGFCVTIEDLLGIEADIADEPAN